METFPTRPDRGARADRTRGQSCSAGRLASEAIPTVVETIADKAASGGVGLAEARRDITGLPAGSLTEPALRKFKNARRDGSESSC